MTLAALKLAPGTNPGFCSDQEQMLTLSVARKPETLKERPEHRSTPTTFSHETRNRNIWRVSRASVSISDDDPRGNNLPALSPQKTMKTDQVVPSNWKPRQRRGWPAGYCVVRTEESDNAQPYQQLKPSNSCNYTEKSEKYPTTMHPAVTCSLDNFRVCWRWSVSPSLGLRGGISERRSHPLTPGPSSSG